MDQNLFKHPVNFFSELHHQMSLDFKPINPEDELIASWLVNMLVLGKGVLGVSWGSRTAVCVPFINIV